MALSDHSHSIANPQYSQEHACTRLNNSNHVFNTPIIGIFVLRSKPPLHYITGI